jgi:hypothetical protein
LKFLTYTSFYKSKCCGIFFLPPCPQGVALQVAFIKHHSISIMMMNLILPLQGGWGVMLFQVTFAN